MITLPNALSNLQRGSTLLVAVVILLLASLMGLMAMNVGLFEQRSSGNDLRAKVVKQVAEAGLAQGFEYLFRANPALLDTAASWEVCAAADTSFPCGAVDASVRGTMHRLVSGAGGFGASTDLPAALTTRMLKVPVTLPQMGGFDVAYGVAPVLCRVPLPLSNTSISCATGTSNLSNRRVVTFVSVAQIKGDSGRTTLTQTVALSSLLAQQDAVPTIVASGTVSTPGNADLVSMPDAAGPGLDLGIWSRLNVTPGGSFAACSLQDFLASGEVSLTREDWISDRACAGCGCGAPTAEGWDILDKDGDSGTNRDVVASEFPCDMFEYTFNVKAWTDTDGDGFCETRMPKVDFEAPDGETYRLYPDEAFLYRYATKIRPADGNGIYVRASQLGSGNLGAADTGLIWCQVDCLTNNIVGSVSAPVAVVSDPTFNTPFQTKLFGLMFYRSNGVGPLNPTTGGNASMTFNASSAVYGAVVIQGRLLPGSGGGLFVGDRSLLKTLAALPALRRYDTLRGGWTDGYSY